jgi:ABC-type transport system involved in cytochrome bd biosynthesis fused ATPase/permease subunit
VAVASFISAPSRRSWIGLDPLLTRSDSYRQRSSKKERKLAQVKDGDWPLAREILRVRQADLLVLDEPTASFDLENEPMKSRIIAARA